MADWGSAPWRIDVAIPPAPWPERADVIVVGAGLTGLSAAYHLARAGLRTVVVEADTIGAGASGRSGAIALEGTAGGPLPEVDDCLGTLARVAGEAGIDCDLRLTGCWEIVHRGDVDPARALWRDGDAHLCVAGTEPGGTVDVGALLAGLARAALHHGATIHEHATATRIEPDRVVCGQRTVRTSHVVVALNAYTATVLPLPVPPSPALTLAVCTAPVDGATLDAIGLRDRLPFYTADLPYLWGRTLRDDRLVFGAGLLFPADGDVRSVDIAAPESAAAFARLESRIHALHPALRDVPITQRWGGPIAFRQGPPILTRHPTAPTIILTGAYSGHGVALSVRTGQLVAAAIAHGAPLPSWGAVE